MFEKRKHNVLFFLEHVEKDEPLAMLTAESDVGMSRYHKIIHAT